MAWLQSLVGTDSMSAVQLVLITLGLVLSLIMITWIIRKVIGAPSRRAGRNRVPRLSITDSTPVDEKRHLVLVRRDDIEHLVLIGGPTDVVVESNIVRIQAPMQNSSSASIPETLPEQAPEQETKPEASMQAAAGTVTAATVAVAAASTEDGEPRNTEAVAEKTVTLTTDETSDDAETASIAEPDLESALSESLDNALSSGEPGLETPEVAVEQDNSLDTGLAGKTDKPDSKKPNDEMQRLLDELADADKEPA